SEAKGKGYVGGVGAHEEQEHHSRSEPGESPGDAHPQCSPDPSQPTLHRVLPASSPLYALRLDCPNSVPIEEAAMEARAKLFGHPIHQMLIVLPLGLLAGAVLFDVLSLVLGGDDWRVVAYWLIPAGVAKIGRAHV